MAKKSFYEVIPVYHNIHLHLFFIAVVIAQQMSGAAMYELVCMLCH